MESSTGKLLKRLWSRKHSYRDQKLLEKRFESEAGFTELASHAREQWNEVLGSEVTADTDLGRVYDRLHDRISKSRRPLAFGQLFFTRVAATLFLPLLLLSGYLMLTRNHQPAQVPVQFSFVAPDGTRSSFVLPDGTTGWLNAGSKLTYSVTGEANRQVDLQGEAFFDVFKDKSHPFTVKTGSFDVRVTGTRFNVCAYPGENVADLVLQSGAVTITDLLNRREIEVKPGQLFALDRTDSKASLSEANVGEYLGWIDGKLFFREEPLDVVAQKLKRFYNINIELVDPELSQLRFRAMLQNESIGEVLRYLEISLPLSAKLYPSQKQPDGSFTRAKVIIKKKR